MAAVTCIKTVAQIQNLFLVLCGTSAMPFAGVTTSSSMWTHRLSSIGLARYPRFQQTVRNVWHTFLNEEYPRLAAFVEDFTSKIASAAVKDGERWPQYSQNPVVDRRDYFMNSLTNKVNFLSQEWGDDTGISLFENGQSPDDKAKMLNDKWYTLDGRMLNAQPIHPGIYLHKGRKTVIKFIRP